MVVCPCHCGAEWEILDQLIEQQTLDVIDILSLEAHGDLGKKRLTHFQKTKAALLHELQRRAPAMRIANETYEGASLPRTEVTIHPRSRRPKRRWHAPFWRATPCLENDAA